ncbi:GPW/gp25 family protein [Sphingomonas sp.]|uniref:GPW/gp25 family protein n=1 Tax=Sphingomonas sp. TaxID=28214 RepID=UPI0035BC0A79
MDIAFPFAFPFAFDARGHTAQAPRDAHVAQMIEQLLLTRPGERVMRPDLGSGLHQAVFAPNSPELATALEFTTRAALQRHLGDIIEVRALAIVAEEERLSVRLDYVIRESGAARGAIIPITEPGT